MTPPLSVYLVAGEESGDQLGAGLMRALRQHGPVGFAGVGGHAMAAEGLASLFPLSDIAVMGIGAVVRGLPGLVRRGFRVVDDVVRRRPDVLVVIDSPDFNQSVARLVHRRLPSLPIVTYVSPSVWAWRPGRAKRMRRYVDHVLALKPFEPEAHRRLGGPPCTYVGHPLTERLAELRPRSGERPALGDGPLRLVVLPGSRRSEIGRLMEPFGETLGRLAQAYQGEIEVTLPAVAHVADEIRARSAAWPVRPRIVEGEGAKHGAFRQAQLALAASGTVTLELALAGVPMVVAYKVSRVEEQYKYLIKVDSIVLANLILGERVVPERIQWDCTPEKLVEVLLPLTRDGPERRGQLDAFARLDVVMEAHAPTTPSERAAAIVNAVAARAGRSA